LQVGFAASSLSAAAYPSREHAAELVLAHHLSTGLLWEAVRMRGGAYGAFAGADGLEGFFNMASYRDPNPERSLGAFHQALLKASSARALGDALAEQSLIGCYGKETYPRSPKDRASAAFNRFLYGIEEKHRVEKIRFIAEMNASGIRAAAKRLAEGCAAAPRVIIAGKDVAEKAAQKLGVQMKELSV
jgi:Zn-dependent M16 (insulinase) family peptidase